MNAFAINLLLAAGWAALAGAFTLSNLVVGFLLGFLALLAAKPLFPDDGYFLRLPRLVRLALVFLRELVLSSIEVTRDVLRPRPRNSPGVIAVPLKARSEVELLLVSSLVTLTPGTLSLDLSDDGSELYVHAMFVDDPERLRAEIVEVLEKPVLEALA
ncbi:MAG: Na+/H+ antiporter subunit E [Paracoccaceae bacterium]